MTVRTTAGSPGSNRCVICWSLEAVSPAGRNARLRMWRSGSKARKNRAASLRSGLALKADVNDPNWRNRTDAASRRVGDHRNAVLIQSGSHQEA